MGYYSIYEEHDCETCRTPTCTCASCDPEPAIDPPTHQTIASLAVKRDGEEMREALLLDILGEVRQLYPHHHLSVTLSPMDTLGQPTGQQRSLPLRQAIVTIVERP